MLRTSVDDAEHERRLRTGRGVWDGMKWEGEAPAEPKRRRVANGDWRLANGETAANGE